MNALNALVAALSSEKLTISEYCIREKSLTPSLIESLKGSAQTGVEVMLLPEALMPERKEDL